MGCVHPRIQRQSSLFVLASAAGPKHKGGMSMRTYQRILTSLCVLGASLNAFGASNLFVGEWALTIPGGAAGWLGVQEHEGKLQGSMLWGWGSVEPVASVKAEDNKLIVTRNHVVEHKDAAGTKTKVTLVETITATLQGDDIKLTSSKQRESGQGEDVAEFEGHRQPPVPPAPDLPHIKFGKAQRLFNGNNLTSWRLTDPNAVNS